MPALDLSTADWRKSSRSTNTSNCVEITFAHAEWRKSTHSDASNTCVEVSFTGPAVALRDSKNPTGPTLALPARCFTTLVATLSV